MPVLSNKSMAMPASPIRKLVPFAEAAKELKMSLQALNNFAKRNNIYWWIIKQGQRNEKT